MTNTIKGPSIRLLIAAVAAMAIFGTLAASEAPTASAATNVHTAKLKGSASFPAVTGKAKFQVDDGIRELEAQIENADRLAGTRVKFRVDGVLVGTKTVNSFGTARIRRTGSAVPAVHTGSTIRVRRASNGVLVASGRFN
jgi:hypothetical protein